MKAEYEEIGKELRKWHIPKVRASLKYEIITDFLSEFDITDIDSFKVAKKRTSGWEKVISNTALFEKFVRKNFQAWYYWDHPKVHRALWLTWPNIDLVLRGVVDEKMRWHYRSDRSIRVLDSEGKEVSFTSKKKSEVVLIEWRWTKIDEITIQLHHVVEGENLIRYESAFQKVLRCQGWCFCNRCKIDLDEVDAEIHHKYIPRCYKLNNAEWNLELLCSDCHKDKHDEFFIKTFIKVVLFCRSLKSELKNIKKSLLK